MDLDGSERQYLAGDTGRSGYDTAHAFVNKTTSQGKTRD